MATYSRNPIVDRRVHYSGSSSDSNARRNTTVFTTGADEYAIINVYFSNNSGNATVCYPNIGTTSISSGGSYASDYTLACAGIKTGEFASFQLYVGPSTTVYWGKTDANGITVRISVTGVVFKNG